MALEAVRADSREVLVPAAVVDPGAADQKSAGLNKEVVSVKLLVDRGRGQMHILHAEVISLMLTGAAAVLMAAIVILMLLM